MEEREPLAHHVINEDGDDDGQIGGEEGGSHGAARRFRLMSKRIKWGMAGGLAGCLVLCTMIIVAVLLPTIVSASMDKVHFTFTSVDLVDPREDSVGIRAEVDIVGTGPFPCSMDAAMATVWFKGEEIGKMELPKMHTEWGGTSSLSIQSRLSIRDRDAFDRFAADLVRDRLVTWTLSAVVTVRIGKLAVGKSTTFRKDVQIEGLSGLKGDLSMQSLDMTASTKQEVILHTVALIQNPSIVSISPLGTLSLSMYYQGSFMGSIVAPNASLARGANLIPMSGVLHPHNLSLAEDLISRFLNGQPSTIIAAASKNATSIAIYAAAFDGLRLEAVVQSQPTNLIQSVEVKNMALTPMDNHNVGMEMDLLIVIDNPLGSNSLNQISSVTLFGLFSHLGKPLCSWNSSAIPVQYVSKEELRLVFSSTMVLWDTGINFGQFVIDFMHQKNGTLLLHGTSDVMATTPLGPTNLRGLSIYNEIEFVGMGGLSNLSLLDFSIPRNSPHGGVEIYLNASVNNPSVASLKIDYMLCGIYYQQTELGRVTVEDMHLEPGTNMLSFSGVILPSNLTEASNFFSNYLRGNDSDVEVKAIATNSSVDWLNKAMTEFNLQVPMPGLHNFTIIRGVDILEFHIDATHEPIMGNTTVRVDFHIPFSFPMDVFQTEMSLVLLFNNSEVCSIQIPFEPSSINQTAGQLVVNITNVAVEVLNSTMFSSFLTEGLLRPTVTIQAIGTATSTASTAMGNVTLSGIPFDETIVIKGANAFLSPPMKVTNVHIIDGTKDGVIEIEATVTIWNPAVLGGSMGSTGFSLFYEDTFIANTTIPNLQLLPGPNVYNQAATFYMPKNSVAGRDFLSSFLKGHNSTVQMRGLVTPQTIPIMKEAIEDFTSVAILPGLAKPIILFAKMEFDAYEIFVEGILPTQLTVQNSFNATFGLTAINVVLFQSGTNKRIASLDKLNGDIQIPPYSVITTKDQPISIEGVSIDFLKSLFGAILIDVRGTVNATINSFESQLDFEQLSVPGSFQQRTAASQ